MKKALASLCLAAVLAVAGTLAFDAFRGPDQTAAVAAKQKAGHKTCTAKTNAGKAKTWQCRTDQACCINRFLDQYVCGIPGLGCI